ncbi:SBBP repeat-containing protein [Cyanobacteria bacterium FACHB-63]|nr:SBBP repeat-containing protein [Cyanobacteria bacterium FACHB-63]
MRTLNLADPSGINNLGILDASKSFQSLLANSTETYNFEIKARSSFSAILNSLVLKSSDGDTNLKLTKAGSDLQVVSNNPGEITDGITRILDPGTYTLTISVANKTSSGDFDGPGYDLALFAEPGIASSIVWRNSLADQTAFWDLDRDEQVGGAFVNNAPQLDSNSDWKLIGAVEPTDNGDRVLVWRNGVTDETAIWTVNGNNEFTGSGFIKDAPKLGSNSNWHLIDANIVNDDLSLLWRDAVADQTAYWTIDDNFTMVDSGFFTNTTALGSNSDWKLLDELVLGDNTQLVWRNAASSETAYWTVDASGSVIDRGFFDAPKVGGEWELTEVAQVGNDPHFIWRNSATNEMAAWFFDGTKFLSSTFIDAPRVGGEWQIASVISEYAEPMPMPLGGESIDTAFDVGVPDKNASFTDSILPDSSNFYTFTIREPQALLYDLSAQGLETKVLNAEGEQFTLEPSQPLAPGKYYFQVTNSNITTATATIDLFANLTPTFTLASTTIGTYEQSQGSAPVITGTPSISDPDSTGLASVRVSITNLKDGADEKLTYDRAGSLIDSIYNANTGVLTLFGAGSFADYEAALKRISYSNTALNPDKSDRIFSIVLADDFTESAAVTTTLKLSFNTAPSLDADVSLGSILENASSPAGETISTFLSNQFSDPDTNSSLKGIAIVGNSAPTSQGRWQFSADGSNWLNVGAVAEANALMLSATTKLRFVPTAFYNGTPDGLTIRVIDNTYTGELTETKTNAGVTLTEPVTQDVSRNGGTSAFSSTTKSIGTSVLSVNQAPTFTVGQNISVATVGGAQIVEAFVTDVTKGAADESNQNLTYEVTVDQPELFTNNGQPTIDPTNGALSYTPAGTAGVATVTVTLKDSGGTANGGSDTTSKTFTITMNEPLPFVQFGTSSDDSAESVAVDSNGNRYIVGFTPGTLSGNTNAGGHDAFLAKYDIIGKQVWVKQFGTSSTDFAYGVAVGSNGNVFVVGQTNGTFTGNKNSGDVDAFLATFDSTGNQIAVKQFGTSSADFARGVAVGSNGSVFVVGETGGAFTDNTNSGDVDAFLATFDSTGNQIAVKQFGTSSADIARGVAVGSSGNVFVVGDTGGAFTGNTNEGGNDAFLATFDSTGNQIATKQFGTSSTEIAPGVAVGSNGNVYIAGFTNGTFTGNTNSGSFDAFLATFDSTGNQIAAKQFGTSSVDLAYGVAVGSNGNVFVVGQTNGAFTGNTNSGDVDAFLTTFDSTGNQIAVKQFGTSSADLARGVAVGSNSSVFVVGLTNGTFTDNTNEGGFDAFLYREAVTSNPAPTLTLPEPTPTDGV